jgi:hypothetical protein
MKLTALRHLDAYARAEEHLTTQVRPSGGKRSLHPYRKQLF